MNYLPAEASSVLATCTPVHARRVRFTVVPPRHYEERRRFEAAIQERDQYSEDDLQQIMNRAQHEDANNRSDLKRLRGQRITFGQRINLVHDATDRTISFHKIDGSATTASKKRTGAGAASLRVNGALAEYEVAAAKSPGPGAVVRIVPGFDTRIEGDLIRHGDVMGLKYDDSSDVFLHGVSWGVDVRHSWSFLVL